MPRNSIVKCNIQFAGYKDVIKTTVLLKDINQFSEINNIYSKFFTDHEPARAAFQVGERREDVDG